MACLILRVKASSMKAVASSDSGSDCDGGSGQRMRCDGGGVTVGPGARGKRGWGLVHLLYTTS